MMGKVIVPHANERERAAFASVNITLLDSISEKDFLNIISAYLSSHNVLHLATCRDNEPRCTALEYFNSGLTVYVFSEGGGKIANLKANPQVSYTINDPYDSRGGLLRRGGTAGVGHGNGVQEKRKPCAVQCGAQPCPHHGSIKKAGARQAGRRRELQCHNH